MTLLLQRTLSSRSFTLMVKCDKIIHYTLNTLKEIGPAERKIVMKIWEDYYHILQVHHNAEQEVIEGAYRRLCKKYHPDINRGEHSEEKIRKINRAYEVLKNPEGRKEFHKLWLNKNNSSLKQSIHQHHEWKKGFELVHNEKAQGALNTYLTALSQKSFEKAYHLLSNWNKRNIVLDEFIQWREAVSKIYGIGNFETRIFNTYERTYLNGIYCEKIIEFDVNISEKNIQSGKVTEYRFTKMLVLEDNNWKVLLEYHDLKALAHKFKYLYHSHTKASAAQLYADMHLVKDETTGLLSKKGFVEELEKEKNRFLRYVNPFCIAIFSIKSNDPDPRVLFNKDHMKYAAYTVNQCIRNTDIAAYINSGVFAVIFTETSSDKAQKAVEHVIKTVKENFLKYYNIGVTIQCGLCEHTGRDENETFYKACTRANVPLDSKEKCL